jgi:hypothetical protein
VQGDAAVELLRSDGHRPGTDFRMGSVRLAAEAPLAVDRLAADVAFAARDFGADGFYGPFPSYEETRTTTASLRLRPAPERTLSLEPILALRRHDDDFVLRREDPAFYRNRHSTLQIVGDLVARAPLGGAASGAVGAHLQRDAITSAALGDHAELNGAVTGELALGRVGVASAVGGLRLDSRAGRSPVLSPSISAALWPGSGMRLRGSAGRAFRAPTWTERYYRDPANIGDPGLQPEHAWSGDAGIDAYPLSGLRLSFGTFIRDASDLIDWARRRDAPSDPWITRNVATARFTGIESEAELEGARGFRLTARGAWTSVRSSAEPGYLSKYALRPMAETLSVDVARRFGDAFDLAVHAVHARRLGQDPYLRIDGRAAAGRERWRLVLDLQNALDRHYLDIVELSAPGRNLSIGMEWRDRSR